MASAPLHLIQLKNCQKKAEQKWGYIFIWLRQISRSMHTPVGSAQHIEEHTKRLINLKSQREAQPTADNGPKVIQKKKKIQIIVAK